MVNILTHFDTGLKYVRGKDKVLFENGVVIPRDEFDKHEKDDLDSIIATFAADPVNCNYSFKYACSTGNLRKIGKPPKKPEKQKETEPVVIKQQRLFSSVLLIMVVMAIVGIGSAIMSAYHTSAFLIYGGKPVWTGVLTGLMLILFSSTAFTAARYFYFEGGLLRFFSVLFIIAGFAVISYSVFATLTVNFEQFQWRTMEKVESSEALISFENRVSINEQALDEVNQLISRLEAEEDFWRERSWRRYDEIRNQIDEAVSYRTNLRQGLVDLENNKPDLISTETVYTLVGRLFGIKEDSMRFFAYSIPACLYDILAPFALSVVLFLIDRRRKEC